MKIIILSLCVVGFLIYFIYKYVVSNKKEGEKYWNYIQLIFLGSGLLFTGILTNQLVQPLVSPRVEDISIKPLYIQTMGEYPKLPDYYAVFEVTYNIAIPLFPFYRNITLKLPGEDVTGENLYFITQMLRKNPYFNLGLDERFLGTFLSYKGIAGSIPIIISINAFEAKKIDVKFLVAEKIDFNEASIAQSDFYWWTDTTIAPEIINRNIITWPYGSILGYGRRKPLGVFRSFHDEAIKNLANIEIRGHKIRVGKGSIWCYEGIEQSTEHLEDGDYISIDLEPRETKHLLVLTPIDSSDVNKKSFQFDYWSETECPGAWLKYKELMGF